MSSLKMLLLTGAAVVVLGTMRSCGAVDAPTRPPFPSMALGFGRLMDENGAAAMSFLDGSSIGPAVSSFVDPMGGGAAMPFFGGASVGAGGPMPMLAGQHPLPTSYHPILHDPSSLAAMEHSSMTSVMALEDLHRHHVQQSYAIAMQSTLQLHRIFRANLWWDLCTAQGNLIHAKYQQKFSHRNKAAPLNRDALDMSLHNVSLAVIHFLRSLRGGQPWVKTVHPFGSLVMGLGGEDSDLDLNITTIDPAELDPTNPWYGLYQRTGLAKPSPAQLVTELEEELRLHLSQSQQLSDLMRVEAVPNTHVPVLKLFLKSRGPAPAKQVEHKLELTFDNTIAVEKSVRFSQLLIVV